MDCLRGIMGLVDLDRESWRQELNAASGQLSTVAIPAAPDQIWDKDLDYADLCQAAGSIPAFLGCGGRRSSGGSVVEDLLEFTETTVMRARQAEAAGAAGVIVPVP